MILTPLFVAAAIAVVAANVDPDPGARNISSSPIPSPQGRTALASTRDSNPRRRRSGGGGGGERQLPTYFGRVFRKILSDRGISQREFTERLNNQGWPEFHQQEASRWIYSDTLPSYVLFAISAAIPDLTERERDELRWGRDFGFVPLSEEEAQIIKRWQTGERLSTSDWEKIRPAYSRIQAIRDRTKKH